MNITDPILFDPDDSKTIYLSVKTDNNYDKATIKLKLTPAWAEDTSIEGKYEYIFFNIENDGSYIEKNNEVGIDLIYYIIVTLVIIIIIIFIFVVIQRKRNK